MIQFVPQGPQIPEEILQALRYDNLVFFCGAGISRPNGLPLFDKLAEKVCKSFNLNINNHPLLKIAKEKEDYAGIFDLLENGQISSLSTEPKILRKEIIKILSTYKKEKGLFENHKALLELSALQNDKGNRLVTTNFDRLFFEAGLENKFSDSAPKLAPPRKETWKNLTFLHGVIDIDRYPEGNNLILTRRDFGRAYLYDTWASRFIIQLFQDFTVLFIGYSADDPVMNYLVSVISYENRRRNENKETGNNKIPNNPSIYAFVGYEENEKEEKENKWKAIGVKPVSYKVENNNHSFLYETIKRWAESKKTGLTGRRNWLKQQLERPYKEETDRQKAKAVISTLKMDEKLAEYLPEINLSSDIEKRKPVDISWLKAFAEGKKESKNESQANSYLFSSTPQAQTENFLLEKLTRQIAHSSLYSLWEPLSSIEKNIARWFCHHLDKKELIHWLIKQAPIQTGLISLHPEFKNMLKWQLRDIKEKEKLDERKNLFWEIITTQEEHSNKFDGADLLICELNEKGYSYVRAKELLACLKPQIGFTTYFFSKELSKIDKHPDLIYEPKLKINTFSHPSFQPLTDQTALLYHAEDWTELLKKAMELAKWARLIENGDDLFYIQKPSIEEHEQNRNYNSWTYLVDLVRDSFDLAMEKDKKLAELLLHKWKSYPYSLFYRLILYSITKHSDLDEEMAIKLFEEKPKQTLWSSSCQREVLKFLRDRNHSKKFAQKILSLIMEGSPRSLYREDLENTQFIGIKERVIYQRLKNLKISGVEFPKNIEDNYNKIQLEYSFDSSLQRVDDKEDFPFFHSTAQWVRSKKLFHNKTNKDIFEIINTASDNPLIIDKKREEFRSFLKDFPDRAFDILSIFQDNGINSIPYWQAFIYEVSMMTDSEKSKKWFLKSFEKIEKFNDKFIKECLSSLIYSLSFKGGLIYSKNKERFKKWWKKLFELSLKNMKPFIKDYSNIEDVAVNSNLGKLSQTVFSMLWSEFPDQKNLRDGKIPKEIKNYFKMILQSEVIKQDPSVLFHFGSHLSRLWYLDREWTIENLKPLIDWSKTETVLVRNITNLLAYSFQSDSNPPEGTKDTLEEYNICEFLWKGYLFHDMFLGPDFLEDFKEEFFHLLLNYKEILRGNYKIEYTEDLAQIFFVTTGGKQVRNIFSQEKLQKIVQNMDTDILSSLSRGIWQLLKNTGEGKSSVLWSEKIKPWIEKFWPQQKDKMNHKIAENLSFAILHCEDKLPEAFEVLKDQIKGVIKQNSNNYIAYYIVKDEEDEEGNNKQDLEHIYDYPTELLKILNWNFPEDKIYYNYDKKIKKILDKLKNKHPGIEKSGQYRELLDKILNH